MNDLRASPRRRTLLGAQILFDNQSSSIDCLVRNISETGARLALESPMNLPDEFNLVIKPQGRTYRAKVMWRRLTLIGVAFA